MLPRPAAVGAAPALAWVAFKVGALSYGGGFVIVPLMQADAVDRYHWMTAAQFLNAVALGQITPGPVMHTVAVGRLRRRRGRGRRCSRRVVAFAPSFAFVLLGARRFDRLRAQRRASARSSTAPGPAAIGAILGAAIPLARALHTAGSSACSPPPSRACWCCGAASSATLLAAAVVGTGLAVLGAGTA